MRITSAKAREQFADILDRAHHTEVVYIPRRGRPVVVMVDAEEYERLVDADEYEADRAALAQARAEDDWVPLEELKAELGL